ncbi:MAG: tRNA 2-selenouridine(34) synthase MnmH, partial [Burkholderiaceae bacterium]
AGADAAQSAFLPAGFDMTIAPVPPSTEAAVADTAPLAPLPLSAYALVIDARSPREYAEDHVPGAVNLPVVDDAQYAEVGTTHRSDPHAAYLLGVEYSLRNIASHLAPLISRFGPDARFLVYCFRGGKRSQLWAGNLRTIGFAVDVIPGGWKRYRAWVRERLETLPRSLSYRVLCGPTGCGKTRLLGELARQGEQVVDLEAIASHRGSLLGELPGAPQPSQKAFDSALLDALREFDPARPVWLEAESKKIGRLQLPDALTEAMRRSPTIHLSVPIAERVRLWREDYAHFAADPVSMVAKLAPLKPLVGGQELAWWRTLADENRTDELFERVMTAHYDPCYARSTTREYGPGEAADRLPIESLAAQALAAAARALIRRSIPVRR